MSANMSLRLITYSEELVNGQPIYVSSNCLPLKAFRLEPAGHAFHSAALRVLGCYEEEGEDEDDQNVPNDKEQSYFPSSGSYSSKGKKKSGAEGKQQDHYALLGLSHLRFLATEDQIRKSYRETALKHHPDKQAALILAEETEAAKQAKKDEIENHFKSIQEAYEVLIDPVKRRIYDSTDEFDDEIPTDCEPQDFFKVFGPAFMRNSRWSVNQPVPTLGEENTPLKEVDMFYNFWYCFKSWREFPHTDEFDLEQAESRDHKRWMERQNAKLSEKARKEEYVRIRSLIDNAYKRDPRILRRKEEERAEKQKKRQAKYLAKKLQEEEAARIAEEEKRQKEEEEKRAAEAASHQKKVKEKEKKLLRKERTRLRTLSAPVLTQNLFNITEDDVESLCMSLETEQLRNLCDKIEGAEGLERGKLLRDARGGNNDSTGKKQGEKNPQHNGSVEVNGNVPLGKYEKKEKPWEREEIELLRKGMQKYPKGTSRRWEVISEYIGTGRSVDEILKATKTVLLQKPDAAKAFDSFLEKRKPAQSIASPLTTREETEGVLIQNGPESNASNKDNLKESSSTSGKQQNPDGAVASNGVTSSSEQDLWSAVQERALVQALKTFPKETNQRWERVAAAVPGKTVNQCKKKPKLMSEALKRDYQLCEEIGRGRFGTVFRCFSPVAAEFFACKSINKLALSDPVDRECLEKEPKVMSLLAPHPHILQIVGVYEDEASLHMVMELCDSSDLFARINNQGFFHESEAASVMKPLLEAIAHCHRNGVAHRDIKPDNVMFDSRQRLKLADFGSAEWCGEGRGMKGVVGTPYYVAPEVLSGIEYTEKVDVWSAGVILYVMLAGVPPFYGDSAAEIFEAVLRGNLRFPTRIFRTVSPAAKDLLRKMICKDVSRRLSAEQALRHPWITNGGEI